MKKLIVIIFLMMSLNGFAKNEGISFYAEYGRECVSEMSYTDIQISYIYKFWNMELMPYAGSKTWFLAGNYFVNGNKPYYDIYTVGTSVKWQNIVITYEHFCAHAVVSKGITKAQKERFQIEDGNYGRNSDKLSIRYQYN